MTRPTLADLDLRQQYLSLVYVRTPGAAAWTVIDQGRVVSPSASAEEQEYSRIGDQNKTKIPGTVTTDLSVQIYMEDDVEELALFFGDATYTAGETIQLTGTSIVDVMIENYDDVTATATPLFVEYINRFRPLNLAINLDAEGDVRVADISGAASAYYIIKV